MRDDKRKVKKRRSVSAWWVSITSPGQLPPPPPTMSATAIATSQLSSSWILNQFTTSILQPNLSSNNLTAFIIELQLSSSWFPDRHHHHRLDFLSLFSRFHMPSVRLPSLKFKYQFKTCCNQTQLKIYSDLLWLLSFKPKYWLVFFQTQRSPISNLFWLTMNAIQESFCFKIHSGVNQFKAILAQLLLCSFSNCCISQLLPCSFSKFSNCCIFQLLQFSKFSNCCILQLLQLSKFSNYCIFQLLLCSFSKSSKILTTKNSKFPNLRLSDWSSGAGHKSVKYHPGAAMLSVLIESPLAASVVSPAYSLTQWPRLL